MKTKIMDLLADIAADGDLAAVNHTYRDRALAIILAEKQATKLRWISIDYRLGDLPRNADILSAAETSETRGGEPVFVGRRSHIVCAHADCSISVAVVKDGVAHVVAKAQRVN